jgi:hypothetical protein
LIAHVFAIQEIVGLDIEYMLDKGSTAWFTTHFEYGIAAMPDAGLSSRF